MQSMKVAPTRFLGFSGGMRVFSNSAAITQTHPQQPAPTAQSAKKKGK
jgi:hypothetical protein